MLAALREDLAAQGVPLLFAIYPDHHAVRNRAHREQIQWAAEMAIGVGLTTIELIQPLLESRLQLADLYLLPLDGHPSPAGYELAAGFLAPAVADAARASARCGVGGQRRASPKNDGDLPSPATARDPSEQLKVPGQT